MKLLRMIATLAFLAASAAALAQSYPSKPGRLIIATTAGSASDVIGRMFVEHLSKGLGQSFVVDNRGGASGSIGLNAGAKAAPDGYTLVFGNLGGSILNQFLFTSLEFDPEKDFTDIGFVAGIPFVVLVNPTALPIKNLQELLSMARAKPGAINVALDSTSVRVAMALLNQATNVKLFAVPYNGPAQATSDVLSGLVPVMINTVGAARPLVNGGKLRALAITTQNATELLPGISSISEQGVTSFGEMTGWVGLNGPRGIPLEVVTLLNTEVNKFLNLPETKARFLTLGFHPRPGSPQDYSNFIVSERARFGPLVKAAGIQP